MSKWDNIIFIGDGGGGVVISGFGVFGGGDGGAVCTVSGFDIGGGEVVVFIGGGDGGAVFTVSGFDIGGGEVVVRRHQVLHFRLNLLLICFDIHTYPPKVMVGAQVFAAKVGGVQNMEIVHNTDNGRKPTEFKCTSSTTLYRRVDNKLEHLCHQIHSFEHYMYCECM